MVARAASSAPKDADGVTMQVLRPMETPGAHQISFTASSARNSTVFNTVTRAVQLWATEDAFIRFGDSTVTAVTTDHFLPQNQMMLYAIGGDSVAQSTNVAAIRDTTNGTLHVTELE